MDIHCNAGITSTTLVGDLPGYGTVWLHEGGIANILSLARVKDKFTVVFHSKQGNEFHVFGTGDRIRVFRQSEQGLYYMDMREQHTGSLLINTVEV